jgi:16S rRNA (guanine527-N7)-methyltransferase
MAEHVRDLEAALRSDRSAALGILGDVSRETLARLDRFVALLLERQRTLNLIARSTVPQIWTRHIADSYQLLGLAPDARRWVDLGSGAGFPGLVIACALAGKPGTRIYLVESTKKKAAFLEEVAAALELPAHIVPERIEDFVKTFNEPVEVVTARALAPLTRTLEYANPLLKSGAIGLFPKGQDVEAELTEAAKYWNIAAELVPSRTDPRGRVVRATGLARKPKSSQGVSPHRTPPDRRR